MKTNRLQKFLVGGVIVVGFAFFWLHLGLATPTKWEYQMMPQYQNKCVGVACEELNTYGDQGWEVVGTYTNLAGFHFFVFKRPVTL